MNVAIIDADLIGRKRHRFPNLVCMKLSAYHKAQGDSVSLKTDYFNLPNFDKVYIAKAFSDTPIPKSVHFDYDPLKLPNVTFGGTGFFFDNAPPLPDHIEHLMPDYHLYDDWAGNGKESAWYHDYSIGFLTRGCFRHCPFCVNRRSNKVQAHSPLAEFLDSTRKKICLLDDNFFGFDDWHPALQQLIDSGKPFTFKQGLDIRLLDEPRAKLLFPANIDGVIKFAFDDFNDAQLISEKVALAKRFCHRKQTLMFYTLCAFDRRNRYDHHFWIQDLKELILRLKLIKSFDAVPYVMRFERAYSSPFKRLYTALARWGNSPATFLKRDLPQFLDAEYPYLDNRDLLFQLWEDSI